MFLSDCYINDLPLQNKQEKQCETLIFCHIHSALNSWIIISNHKMTSFKCVAQQFSQIWCSMMFLQEGNSQSLRSKVKERDKRWKWESNKTDRKAYEWKKKMSTHHWESNNQGTNTLIDEGKLKNQCILMGTDREREVKVGQLLPSQMTPVSFSCESGVWAEGRHVRGIEPVSQFWSGISPRASLLHCVPRLSLTHRRAQICHIRPSLKHWRRFVIVCLVSCWLLCLLKPDWRKWMKLWWEGRKSHLWLQLISAWSLATSDTAFFLLFPQRLVLSQSFSPQETTDAKIQLMERNLSCLYLKIQRRSSAVML